MKLGLKKRLEKNIKSLKKRRKRQVKKEDVMLEIVKDTEILDAQEFPDSMDLGVTREDKKMKGIVESCCKHEDLPKYDLSNSKHTSGEASSASCDVCMTVFSISDFIRAPSCNHRFCKDCIEAYLLKEIQEDATHVVCPESKCEDVLKPDFCRKFIPEQLFDRWKSELNLGSSFGKMRIACPNSDCEGVFMDDGKGYNIRACPKCWNLICMARGRVEWHMEEDCDTFWKRTHYHHNGRRRFAGNVKQHDSYLESRYGFNHRSYEDNNFWDIYHNHWN